MPVAVWNRPAVQLRHATAPVLATYAPAAHGKQLPDAVSAEVPTAQALQLESPAAAKVPAAQLTHATELDAPVTLAVVPAAQLVHAVAEPVAVAYLPARHLVQLHLAVPEKVPAAQPMHTLEVAPPLLPK